VLDFAERHELLFRRFENRQVVEIEVYFDAMMRVTALSAADSVLKTALSVSSWLKSTRWSILATRRRRMPTRCCVKA